MIMESADKLLNYINMLPNNYKSLNIHDIKVNGGKLITTGIINNNNISIAEMHIDNVGISSDWHSHKEREIFIFQRGAPYHMELEGRKKIFVISKDVCCFIPPNVRHRILNTSGESWSLVILIPGSSIFPQGILNE